jgi:hypothetical protein
MTAPGFKLQLLSLVDCSTLSVSKAVAGLLFRKNSKKKYNTTLLMVKSFILASTVFLACSARFNSLRICKATGVVRQAFLNQLFEFFVDIKNKTRNCTLEQNHRICISAMIKRQCDDMLLVDDLLESHASA